MQAQSSYNPDGNQPGVTLTIKPDTDYKKLIGTGAISFLTTGVATGTTVASIAIVGVTTIPLTVLGFVGFCSDQIRMLIGNQHHRNSNKSNIQALERVLNKLDADPGNSLIPKNRSESRSNSFKSKCFTINFINGDEVIVVGEGISFEIKASWGISSTDENHLILINPNNPLEVKGLFKKKPNDTSLVEKDYFGRKVLNCSPYSIASNIFTLLNISIMSVSMILGIIAISLRDEQATNFKDTGTASIVLAIVAFAMALLVTLLAPAEQILKIKELNSRYVTFPNNPPNRGQPLPISLRSGVRRAPPMQQQLAFP